MSSNLKKLASRYPLYIMAIPGVLFFVLFYLIPSAGILLAWQDYNFIKGFMESPWVGWKHFRKMFEYSEFLQILKNTLSIGFLKLILGFPFPVFIALLLNEVKNHQIKKFSQTIMFMPHLLSWVVVSQIFYNVLSPDSGIVNNVLHGLTGMEPVFFMAKEELIQPLIAISHVWKESGYTSVVYLAALSSISPELYEAADLDGAGKMTKILRISLPLIAPTMVIMFLITMGRFLETGFDHVYNMLNPLVWSKGDILNTYIYRVGLQQGKYSFTTAVGLFKSLVGLVLIVGGNWGARKITGRGFFK
ncbi:MAG: ABC transporter permease subunit [Spirochaetales bacterium]|nr:ABC transporter permease subunit [Spirochaetales bacterium]